MVKMRDLMKSSSMTAGTGIGDTGTSWRADLSISILLLASGVFFGLAGGMFPRNGG